MFFQVFFMHLKFILKSVEVTNNQKLLIKNIIHKQCDKIAYAGRIAFRTFFMKAKLKNSHQSKNLF